MLWHSIHDECLLPRAVTDLKGRQKAFVMRLHMCVNSDSFCITFYSTATSRDWFHTEICVCMYNCVNILCASKQAVKI